MRRDRYHDYVTDLELADASASLAKGLLALRIDSLCRRANPSGCRSGFYEVMYDPCFMAYQIRVFFDSSTWTGHDGTTPWQIFRRKFLQPLIA